MRPLGLTPKQQRLLAFIREYMDTHDGVAPCYAEMAAALGMKRSSGIFPFIVRLEQRGHITRRPFTARSIAVVAAGRV